jgi:hypothetical protein
MMIADSIPAAGWAFSTYEPYARYGTNYYGLRGRLSILSEAFSHDPFARRVASTYDFVSEALSYIAERRKAVIALGAKADAQMAAWGRDPSKAPPLAVRSEMDTTRVEDVRVEMIRPLADSTKREPGMGNRERTGVVKLVRMPMMVSFRPTVTNTLPFAYGFNPDVAEVLLPILKLHGIQVERLQRSTLGTTIQTYAIDSIVDRGQSESARRMRAAFGHWDSPEVGQTLGNAYIVRTTQPSALLAFYLLEPENDDGLLSWGFFEGHVGPASKYPVFRITKPITLRSTPVK